MYFSLKFKVLPAVVSKLELLNRTIGMGSEVRQLLLSVRKLNLCDNRLLSSGKLACIVFNQRMECSYVYQADPFYASA